MSVIWPAGCGYSTELPDFDFEIYSEAGYVFDPAAQKWALVAKSAKNGLAAVGAAVYSEHESTEPLSLSYNLKDGRGDRLWIWGQPDPVDLFRYIESGGLIEAHNSGFEYLIWKNVCHARLGWPALDLDQLRDSMAKAQAHGLPGALDKVAAALGTPVQKIADGKRLLRKFSIPRSPTKKDPRQRIRPEDDPDDAGRLYAYNIGDIQTEAAVSARCPDLSPTELRVWLMDQRINARGVGVDVGGLTACKAVVKQAMERGIGELPALTGGLVDKPTEISKIKDWAASRGVSMPCVDAAAVTTTLERPDIPPDVRRVLEVRASLGAASVKKLAAMDRRLSADGRLRGLFMYCGAGRTGRWAGRGVQPQNLPNSGPPVFLCPCRRHFGALRVYCPWCGRPAGMAAKVEWGLAAVDDALYVIRSGSLECVEYFFGDAIAVVSGCLRGLLCAGPGHELISSDYKAIEAVVLAVLAGEEWRIEVFRTHGLIYEASASKITGVPFDDFLRHKKETGEHHPLRKKMGKFAELASGYQGWIGAWKAFGADKYLTDEQIKNSIIAWREASPMIVKLWGELEKAAKAAIRQPGTIYTYRYISYGVKNDVLYCRLPSGRLLSYHAPRIQQTERYGRPVDQITYMGWNSSIQKWMRLDTYGGKLAENNSQAVARDILAHGMLNLEAARYPVIMHVHDEPVSEVPIGFGSVEEYESLICQLPGWCVDWPVKASGGWRGQRFRKD